MGFWMALLYTFATLTITVQFLVILALWDLLRSERRTRQITIEHEPETWDYDALLGLAYYNNGGAPLDPGELAKVAQQAERLTRDPCEYLED